MLVRWCSPVTAPGDIGCKIFPAKNCWALTSAKNVYQGFAKETKSPILPICAMDNESNNQQNDAVEFEGLSREDLCAMIKRQRELIDIKFEESYGRINHCCIRGCIEMDIDTERHASDRVRTCESCEKSYCMNHGGKKKEIICSICGKDDDVFRCPDCIATNVGPLTCSDCEMKAYIQRARAIGANGLLLSK